MFLFFPEKLGNNTLKFLFLLAPEIVVPASLLGRNLLPFAVSIDDDDIVVVSLFGYFQVDIQVCI